MSRGGRAFWATDGLWQQGKGNWSQEHLSHSMGPHPALPGWPRLCHSHTPSDG